MQDEDADSSISHLAFYTRLMINCKWKLPIPEFLQQFNVQIIVVTVSYSYLMQAYAYMSDI